MGIDPGTNFMGYAIIKVFGKNQKTGISSIGNCRYD